MIKKRGRKPEIKADDLIKAGYTYKMDILTDEERDEWVNGKKGIDSRGRPARYESEDFDYFFKILENGAEIRIYHAIRKFYYNNVRIKYADSLPRYEKHASEQTHWNDLQLKVEDTEPIDFVMPDTIKPGQQVIVLQGGPLDGKERVYLPILKFYMEPYDFKIIEGRRSSISARYIQDKENKLIYHFEKII